MKPIRWLFWTLLFLLMLLGVDQFFLHVPPLHPAHAAVSGFYQDFRGRLLDMTFATERRPAVPAAATKSPAKPPPQPAAPAVRPPAGKAASIEEIIDTSGGATKAGEAVRRYLYTDAAGALQFADSLQQVPERYRADAQPLGAER
ncbi:MAG: hypothetical protein RQ723_05875 [Desulfuromonadales bacterium]|nr:hypothetical protein [Desulfuromonadales bacterium]